MKSVIIFYASLCLFVVGGILFTGQSLQSKKKAAINKNNFAQLLLESIELDSGSVAIPEIQNKNIVVLQFSTDKALKESVSNWKELEKLKKSDQLVLLSSDLSEEEFRKLGIEVQPGLFYVSALNLDLIKSMASQVFMGDENVNRSESNVIVINKQGELLDYLRGSGKEICTKAASYLKMQNWPED